MPSVWKKIMAGLGILLILFGLFGFWYVSTSGRISELWSAVLMGAFGLMFVFWAKSVPTLEAKSFSGGGATTIVSFPYTKSDLLSVADTWAKENGFKTTSSGDAFRLYNKGSYLSWNAHPSVKVEKADGKATVEAWINPIFGGRMEISSGNFLGSWAKTVAREQVNKLLTNLSQNPIA